VSETKRDSEGVPLELRTRAPKNVVWTPRPGWVTVRLVGTCADPALRRGQIVMHQPHEDADYPGAVRELPPGSMVIVLAREAHLVEDDLHLLPEEAVVAVGEALP
jgi:hypothetical protein